MMQVAMRHPENAVCRIPIGHMPVRRLQVVGLGSTLAADDVVAYSTEPTRKRLRNERVFGIEKRRGKPHYTLVPLVKFDVAKLTQRRRVKMCARNLVHSDGMG
jgi:hypothetical protein